MDKRFAVVGVIFLFLTLCFSGCEEIETKPDYITVECRAELTGILMTEYNTSN